MITGFLTKAIAILVIAAVPIPDGGSLPDNDIVMKALVEELTRTMEHLQLEHLPKPYFAQFNAQDRLTFTMRAAYGGVLRADENRSRHAITRVRVGEHALDNTNVGRGFGGRTSLPHDDDITALRHTIWQAVDTDYKQAVETLTRKRAWLKDKKVEDRPDDFTPGEPVVAIEPSAEIGFDGQKWRGHLERLSDRFRSYPQIQNAGVSFFAGAANNWIVNSEGTRIRKADTGVFVQIHAQLQGDDGMSLSDSRTFLGLTVDDLPPIEEMLEAVDKLSTSLIALSEAPLLNDYVGPVLFEPVAAGKVLEALLADRICARPSPLGASGWGDRTLERRIGLRILPRSFNVVDDPRKQRFEGTVLAGSYTFDDEGTPPQRVELVEKGILKTLLAGRAPTQKIKQTTGHARSAGFGDPRASIGCLYVEDELGVSAEELEAELIDAARDEGLAFGLRVVSMERGSGASLGDPIMAYKVYVEDGREELVRGLEFLPVQTRALRRILAGGKEREVYNSAGGVPTSIIAPALLFEELELTRIEREFDRPPILPSPLTRTGEPSND